VRTVGVDLAVQPNHTAVAVLDWETGMARLVGIEIPADDDAVLRWSVGADKVGIDCPLGWSAPFVEFLQAHRVAAPAAALDWRGLAYRRTDQYVRAVTALTPLSVSTDRIGLTAMRAARLESRLAACGQDVRRDGAGLIVGGLSRRGTEAVAAAAQPIQGTGEPWRTQCVGRRVARGCSVAGAG
jgi:uncharacterized protein DUF429